MIVVLIGSSIPRIISAQRAASDSNWLNITQYPTIGFNTINFIDSVNGWGIAGTQIKRTRDGGKSWESSVCQCAANLSDLDFIDTSTGIAISRAPGQIYTTSDGGASWQPRLFESPQLGFHDIQFFASDLVWIVGDSGMILRSTNAGTSWMQVASPARNISLRTIAFHDRLKGILLGWPGIIYVTSNGGSTWVRGDSLGHESSGLFFVDSTSGWVYGDGAIFRTSDGGNHWEKQFERRHNRITGVSFRNSLEGYAVGWFDEPDPPNPAPSVSMTTDGGFWW